MRAFDGQTALVTGGASGIGARIAARCAREGARVVVADIDQEAGEATAAACGGRYARLDVSEPQDWRRVLDDLARNEGDPGIVCLNAGLVTGEADISAIGEAAYRRIMAVNVDGVVLGARAVLAVMGAGAIVATASLAGITPMPNDPVYAATKHAVVGFVRSLAPTVAGRGITVNAVCPGIADTALVPEGMRAALAERGFPLIDPDTVAAAVLTAATSGQTGACWVVQAGREAEPYRFRGVPGPRVAGAEGAQPWPDASAS